MRTFIAIELEEEIKAHLAEVQAETQKLCRKGNYVPKDNFHITLHFLGEIEEDDIEYLQDAMYETARRNRPFTLTLDKIGFFPRGNKGIMWAGLEKSTHLRHWNWPVIRFFAKSGKSATQSWQKSTTSVHLPQFLSMDRTSLEP